MNLEKKYFKLRLGILFSLLSFSASFTALVVSILNPMAAPASVVVAFDTAGGTPVDMVSIPGGGRLTSLPNTSKEGAVFQHWLKGNDPVTLDTVFNTNTTVRALFTDLSFTITYQTNGGNSIPEETIGYGESLRLPIPLKTDAIFQGWFTNEALSAAVESESIIIDRDYTFYAKWSTLGEDLFTVSFFSEGLGLIETLTVAPGTDITLPTPPSREDFTFVNWVDGFTFTDILTASFTINQDTVFFAKWVSNAGLVTITFDTQGGTPVAPMQVPIGSSWQDPETIPYLAEGYQFLAWITACNFDGFEVSCTTLDETYVIQGDLHVLAQYDYMIPLSSMRFETFTVDNRIIGYRLASIDYYSDTVIPTVVLPAKFSGLPVVAIGEYAFENVDFIERVIIPENIQYIEYAAFRNSSIQEVFLPDTLIKIYGEAFFETDLEVIHWNLEARLREIHNRAFSETQLSTIAFPRTLEYIGGEAFKNVPLTAIEFPLGSRLNFLGYRVFEGTLLTMVELPENLRTIQDSAFVDVVSLTSIYLPSTLQKIGNDAFAGTGLTSITFGQDSQLMRVDANIFGIPDEGNVIPLVENNSAEFVIVGPVLVAYQGVANDQQTMVIPEGVRVILNEFNQTGDPFDKASLSLPSTLKSIGYRAFANGTFRDDIALPNLYLIADYAFEYVTIEGTLTFEEIERVDYAAFRYSTIDDVVFNPSTIASHSELASSMFVFSTINSITLSEGYLKLPDYFTAYSSIKTLVLPNSITRIEYWAIGSDVLETITFAGEDPLIEIDSNTLQLNRVKLSPWFNANAPYITLKNYLVYFDVTGLNAPYDVTIPNGITAIADRAFFDAFSFNSILLNEVTFIDSYAFNRWPINTQFLNGLHLDNLTYFGYDLTYNFANLVSSGSITFGDNNQFNIDTLRREGFPYYYFMNILPFDDEGFKIFGNILLKYDANFDTTPASVVIPDFVEIISENAFYQQILGGPLTLSSQLKWIQYYGFAETQFQGNITLPEGLKWIDYGAFYRSNLTAITIPASVTSISDQALNSQVLTSIQFTDPSNLRIDNSAFGYLDDGTIKDVPANLRGYLQGSFLIIDGVLVKYYGYQKNLVIPEGVINLMNGSFNARNRTIETIRLPSSATYFANDLFSWMENLTFVDFSAVTAVTYLGQNLFAYTRVSDVVITAPISFAHHEMLQQMPYLIAYDLNLIHPQSFKLSYGIDIVD